MITSVTVRHFKRFEDEEFGLEDSIVLAGPNNEGKTTLLQAIALWKFGLDRWMEQRGESTAKKRIGVPITRQQLTTMPLREMNLMWTDRTVAAGTRGTAGRKIEFIVQGRTGGDDWRYGLEFQYQSAEMVYVRPTEDSADAPPPQAAQDLSVVHIPALSGIEREETRHDRGYQDMLLGQGRSGEILRNLLVEVSGNEGHWDALVRHMRELFGIELQPPAYSPGQPFIVCEYLPAHGDRPLDLASAGSGLLQVLLILGFYYARPATVLLMDEPDAHLHVILQKEVYGLIRRVAAQRGSQLVVATHSEVVLDATDAERVLAFIGEHPRRLASKGDRDRLREALKRLTTTDLLLANDVGAVLYLEGDSDESILGAWARVLEHSAQRFLQRPYVDALQGRRPRDAAAHFFALQAAVPHIQGLCVLDRDSREMDENHTTAPGLRILHWNRYEIENYLLVPSAIRRYCAERADQPGGLFAHALADEVEKALADEFPPAALRDPLRDHEFLRTMKASEFLVSLLEQCGVPTSKSDLYLIAATMQPHEVHPDVIAKLDEIAQLVPAAPQDAPA